MQLHPDAEASGARLIAHDTLGSTNAEALSRARAGEAGPLWVTAARQTAGRGRRGNAWVSEPGNLYASLLLTDPAPAAVAPQLCFVAGLALRDAVQHLAPVLDYGLKLKWPNDLLVYDRKIAGILIESETGSDRRLTVAVGIGVNCASHPADTAHPAAHLGEFHVDVTPDSLMRELSRTMQLRLAHWGSGEGFADMRFDWIVCAYRLSQYIRVRLSDIELTGRFETIDESGQLCLLLPTGELKVIAVGEVFAPIIATDDGYEPPRKVSRDGE